MNGYIQHDEVKKYLPSSVTDGHVWYVPSRSADKPMTFRWMDYDGRCYESEMVPPSMFSIAPSTEPGVAESRRAEPSITVKKNYKKTTKGTDKLDSSHDKVDEGDNCCVICLERAKAVAFDPCGHIICCITCVKELQQQAQNSNDNKIGCPECRQKANKVLRVYNS